MFDESKKFDSQHLSRCDEVEWLCYLLTFEKRDISKSFHSSKEILSFTKEELTKMDMVPPTGKSAEAAIGKLLGSSPILFYMFSSFL